MPIVMISAVAVILAVIIGLIVIIIKKKNDARTEDGNFWDIPKNLIYKPLIEEMAVSNAISTQVQQLLLIGTKGNM